MQLNPFLDVQIRLCWLCDTDFATHCQSQGRLSRRFSTTRQPSHIGEVTQNTEEQHRERNSDERRTQVNRIQVNRVP